MIWEKAQTASNVVEGTKSRAPLKKQNSFTCKRPKGEFSERQEGHAGRYKKTAPTQEGGNQRLT